MTFAEQILSYQFSLKPPFPLMDDIQWLMPHENEETRRIMSEFYTRFYGDHHQRIYIIGINPGRHGAGLTGVPFTDPIRLEEIGIENTFPKRQELSSVFIYEMITQCGGPVKFFETFYITSMSPLGFTRHGKNYNYYDDKELMETTRPYIVDNIKCQLKFGADDSIAYCLGQGKNFTFLDALNNEYGWWKKIVPLPHPRWVMQYRLRRKQEFIDQYTSQLAGHLKS